jgi:hypothetical protein
MFPACDISKYQGAWQDYPCDIVSLKIGGGDDGFYFDPDAATNYDDAKAAGKHVGGYWFIGWVLGAAQEASRFCVGMAPKTENDVYELDVENGVNDIPANGPEYVLEMVNYIHSQTGVYPIIYMNASTYNSFDWSAVMANCGLWVADWNNDPTGESVKINHTFIMQQYSDGPVYDHDEYYGPSLASFDEYGYHAVNDPTVQQAAPATPPAPVAPPAPETPPTPAPTQPTEPIAPVVIPPETDPTPAPVVPPASKPKATVVTTPKTNLVATFINWLRRVKWL